jgi:hypothetical protein
LEERAQGIINKKLVSTSHLLIAVFRSRIGSPTGKEISGTVEEIKEFKKAGKPILLYFYQGDVSLRNLDAKQLSLLGQFKQEVSRAGLVGDYGNISQLREHLAYHLTSVVREMVGSRSGSTEMAGATTTEPRRKRAEKKSTGDRMPTRKTGSLSGSKGTRGVVDATGDWVLLDDGFYQARRVRHHKDNTVTAEIPSQSAEKDAALGRYRPRQYAHPSPVAFAHGNYGRLVRVTAVESLSEGTEQVWTLTLSPEEAREGFGSEVTFQTSGRTYTPDDFAKMRAGRILLNDPPPPVQQHGFGEDTMLEHYLSGADGTLPAMHCIIQDVFRRYHDQPRLALQFARLAAIYYLLVGGAVEAVQELSLGLLRSGKVHVRFRGRCRQRYANEPPATMQIEGDCPLE